MENSRSDYRVWPCPGVAIRARASSRSHRHLFNSNYFHTIRQTAVNVPSLASLFPPGFSVANAILIPSLAYGTTSGANCPVRFQPAKPGPSAPLEHTLLRLGIVKSGFAGSAAFRSASHALQRVSRFRRRRSHLRQRGRI